MAYGGAGVFMTAPVIQKVTELPCLDKDDSGNYVLRADQGDRLLYNCLHNYTELTLSYLPRLRQEDQMGDASGFYESGIQRLSFHHYHTWHELSPGKMHIVSDACGEDCAPRSASASKTTSSSPTATRRALPLRHRLRPAANGSHLRLRHARRRGFPRRGLQLCVWDAAEESELYGAQEELGVAGGGE